MLLLPTSNDGKLDSSHVRMIRDLDLFLEHPWGRDCFDFTMKSIKMRKQAGMCQSTMAIQGFVHGLQLVAMSCIPELLSFATTVTNKRKKETCISAESDDESDFEGAEKPLKFSMSLVKKLDTERPVNVSYTLHATDLEGADLSWSTETADENVLYMLDLLQKNQIFSNDSWSGGVDAADVPPEKEVNAKGKKGKEKCVAAAVPPFIKDKVKRKNKTDIGQTSDSSATLTVADVQDVVDKSSGFDAKFSRLLEVQDLALKAGMKHMSDKIYCLSNQIDVIKLQQIADKELMSSHRVDAGVQKVTVKLPQTENLQAQGHLNKDVMDVVNEILDKAETSNETPLTDGALAQPINTDNAQPIDKISDSIKPPTFSLGLTQDLIPAAVEANTHTSDSLIRNLKTKQRTKRKLPTTTEPPTKQQKKTTAISPRHDPVPTVDDAAFQMLLKVVKTKSAFKIGNDASVSRGPFKELWEQTKRLSDLVMDKLIVLLQEPSLPFLIRRCATNNEMKTDAKTPFDFNCYEGSWEIKPKGAHGIATVLLLELHASSTLTLTSKLDQECVKNAGKNYGITLYEKFNSPLQVG
ncbi:hypothetical protein AALP_AA3G159300 [Arabis alpina]|uniref:DUF1985 domain-containing protein n=1 Tax=Arabis alpina TaxID=50452 RepID=A0A087H9H8_ARAAL|nr:hypothetical protein AALP_AA3G159300 [Arabis alpina]